MESPPPPRPHRPPLLKMSSSGSRLQSEFLLAVEKSGVPGTVLNGDSLISAQEPKERSIKYLRYSQPTLVGCYQQQSSVTLAHDPSRLTCCLLGSNSCCILTNFTRQQKSFLCVKCLTCGFPPKEVCSIDDWNELPIENYAT